MNKIYRLVCLKKNLMSASHLFGYIIKKGEKAK